MIDANDGGVDISRNGGETWFAPPLPIAQFYHVAADTRRPYRVAGAMQDLGTAQGPSNSLTRRHPPDRLARRRRRRGRPRRLRPERSEHRLRRRVPRHHHALRPPDRRVAQRQRLAGEPVGPRRRGHEVPLPVDRADRRLAARSEGRLPRRAGALPHARRRPDAGTSISPDLTRNDKSKQKWAGGPITGDNTGVETYCTVFAIAESPKQKGLIWAGSDDGLVHVTRDDGKNWTNVTAAMPGFPEWGTVSMIEPSPFDAGTAYVVVDAHRLDDMRPYLYKTTDFGKTWKRLDGELAAGRLPARGPRGSEEARTAVPRHRARRDVLDRRRADLAAAAAEPADGRRPRPGRQGRRPGRRHARPVDLDPRRPAADPRVRRDRSRRRPLHLFAPADAIAVALRLEQLGHARRLPESAARRVDLLLAEGRRQGRAEDRDPRRAESGRPDAEQHARREPMGSDDNEDPEDFKNAALPRDAGVQRAVWDLALRGRAQDQGRQDRHRRSGRRARASRRAPTPCA